MPCFRDRWKARSIFLEDVKESNKYYEKETAVVIRGLGKDAGKFLDLQKILDRETFLC